MKDLFIPSDLDEGFASMIKDKNKLSFANFKGMAWVYAIEGVIYCSDNFFSNHNNLRLAEGSVYDLCYHGGKIYDCGLYGVYDTLEDIQLGGLPGSKSMCSNKDKLCIGGDYGFGSIDPGEEFPVFMKQPSMPLVFDICSHHGAVYYSFRDIEQGFSIKRYKGRVVDEDIEHLPYISSFNDILYASVGDKIYDIKNEEEPVAYREKDIYGFEDVKDVLIDYGVSGVFETFTDRHLFDMPVNCLISVPKEVVRGFL